MPHLTASLPRCNRRTWTEARPLSGGRMLARAATVVLALVWAPNLDAQSASPAEPTRASLTELSLEELMSLEVTLAGRREQRLFDTATAIYVITREDLRRSGATSVPEALRMVPGVHVARVGSSKWAISARGFTDAFSNKLLVLLDGRSIYSPLFAGVFWDSQDLVLEDVERIEVVRGPGATLWGANAVNGVINIVTRDTAETRGGLVSLTGGREERPIVSARYGGSLGSRASYRVYARHAERDSFVDAASKRAADQWDATRGGVRVDWDIDANDELMFQASAYSADIGQTIDLARPAPVFVETLVEVLALDGANALARWNHQFSEDSEAQLQLYYDHTMREDTGERRDTFDLELQHGAGVGSHQLIWGLGYRISDDRIVPSADGLISFEPDSRTDQLFSAFLQDEMSFANDELRLTLGSKLEHNDYTGFSLQPNLRLLWMPSERHVLWTAVSRAVRTPSRGDHDLRFEAARFPGPQGLTIVQTILGDRSYGSESLSANELGYRTQPASGISFERRGLPQRVLRPEDLRAGGAGSAARLRSAPASAPRPRLQHGFGPHLRPRAGCELGGDRSLAAGRLLHRPEGRDRRRPDEPGSQRRRRRRRQPPPPVPAPLPAEPARWPRARRGRLPRRLVAESRHPSLHPHRPDAGLVVRRRAPAAPRGPERLRLRPSGVR